MRRHSIRTTTSSHSVCLFCAHRLSADAHIARRARFAQRRQIHHSRSAAQSSNAAAAEQRQDGQQSRPSRAEQQAPGRSRQQQPLQTSRPTLFPPAPPTPQDKQSREMEAMRALQRSDPGRLTAGPQSTVRELEEDTAARRARELKEMEAFRAKLSASPQAQRPAQSNATAGLSESETKVKQAVKAKFAFARAQPSAQSNATAGLSEAEMKAKAAMRAMLSDFTPKPQQPAQTDPWAGLTQSERKAKEAARAYFPPPPPPDPQLDRRIYRPAGNETRSRRSPAGAAPAPQRWTQSNFSDALGESESRAKEAPNSESYTYRPQVRMAEPERDDRLHGRGRFRINLQGRSPVAQRDDPFNPPDASQWKYIPSMRGSEETPESAAQEGREWEGKLTQARTGRFVPFGNGPVEPRPESGLRQSEPRSATGRDFSDENKTAFRHPVEYNDGRPPVALGEQAQSRPGRSRRSGRFTDYDNTTEEAPRRPKSQVDRRNRAAVTEYGDDNFDSAAYAARKAERKKREQRKRELAPPTPIYLPEFISVSNLANKMKIRADAFVRKMEELGFEDIQNDDILTSDNSSMIAMELNFDPILESTEGLDIVAAPIPEDTSDWPQRPPVVTIMGHVDHGKTTILDYLRKSSVAATEFGGITQHIGAFSVPLSSGKMITFLDTPGHAAFLNMRQRGANVTDIVVLVVAADDSVMPQTIEAIKHAQGAGVPIIVAINKIDKEDANPERVKQDLARNDVVVEEYGGDTQVVEVSGKTGQGIGKLEESITTLSEILDHRATTEGPVEGWVLEVQTKKSGRAATVLVRRGTLKTGDFLVAGTSFARVRTIKNEAGVEIESVSPGIPAEIDGWRGMPEAGDEVLEAPTEQRAADVTEYRETKIDSTKLLRDMEAIAEYRRMVEARREKEEAIAAAVTAAEQAGEDPHAAAAAVRAENEDQAKESGPKRVPFIIKADVSGSAEAVENYIQGVGNSEVGPRVLRTGVGVVSEFDIEHAAVAGGHVIAFNTTVAQDIRRLAADRGVRLLEQNIIYRVVDDVKAVLTELLPPLVTQRVTGEAVVLQVFKIGLGGKKTMAVAGCRVTNGSVGRNNRVKVLRGSEKLYDGTITSLKQVKKEVNEMQKGSECGMGFEDWSAFEAGDTIQCYEERHEKRYL